MRVPKIAWIAVLVGSAVLAAIVWSGSLSKSRSTDQARGVPEARRSELAGAVKALGTIAAAHTDQPNPPETRSDAEPTPEKVNPPPADVPPPVSRRSKPAEITWAVKPPSNSDGSSGSDSLCGGKVCRADQFCCGPSECGHCASRMTGPRCPTSCP
jgi:hypothetical protein